jgi:tRNA1(Val) A37 N6-methylase TrmN6
MFGKIKNIQDISDNCPKLCKNFKFVGVATPISEEKLLALIESAYNSKNKIELEKCLNIYKKEYQKTGDILHKYESSYGETEK